MSNMVLTKIASGIFNMTIGTAPFAPTLQINPGNVFIVVRFSVNIVSRSGSRRNSNYKYQKFYI